MNLKDLKNKLQNYFVNSESEWINIYTTATKRVDITIVSDKVSDSNNVKKFIEEAFTAVEGNFRLGFLSLYTLEDAEMLEIDRPKNLNYEPMTWESMVQNYHNDLTIRHCNKTERSSKVISFYSYKGGVGRTVALIQTAYNLVQKGKNVLLLDLDIEAPSLFDIFQDQMDVKHGLVDYLYEQVITTKKEDNKLRITDIFSEIKFQETLEGNMYVVPSGILSPEYVYKLKQLQPRMISQNQYMNDLIGEFEKNLNVDVVLIDSRTGLNDWGAFSLLEVADDIIFFAYPNEENVKGLKLVIDLMKNYQCKNLTLALSRIDPEGMTDAEELFTGIGLEQEFISIIYNPRIAVANKFPVLEALDEYKKISEFILEKELTEKNKFYLTVEKNRKATLLNVIMEDLLNNRLSKTTEPERKAMHENINFIVGRNEVLEDLIANIKDEFTFGNSLNTQNLIGRTNKSNVSIISNGEDSFQHFIEFLKGLNSSNQNWRKLWISYILFIVNSIDKKTIIGLPELRDKAFKCYYRMIEGLGEEELVELLRSSTKNSSNESFLAYDLEETPRYVLLIFHCLSSIEKYYKVETGWLRGIFEAIAFLRENNLPNYNIKVFIEDKFYENNKKEFIFIKGNFISLEWTKKDIHMMLLFWIAHISIEKTVDDYIFALTNSQNCESFVKKMSTFKNQEKMTMKLRLESDVLNSLHVLLLGTRINPKLYTKPVIDWFYDEMIENDIDIDPISVTEIIKSAIKYELAYNISDYSLLSTESLTYGIQQYKEKNYMIREVF